MDADGGTNSRKSQNMLRVVTSVANRIAILYWTMRIFWRDLWCGKWEMIRNFENGLGPRDDRWKRDMPRCRLNDGRECIANTPIACHCIKDPVRIEPEPDPVRPESE
jgi:hypothetical protein